MPPLPADSIHARACKLKCEKILTRPRWTGRHQESPLKASIYKVNRSAAHLGGAPAVCTKERARTAEPLAGLKTSTEYTAVSDVAFS